VKRVSARPLYYGLSFARAMAVGWVVFDLYLVRVLDFSPLELILMGTAMEATIFVSEVPTGVIADTYSRRLSFVIGVIGMGGAVIGVGLSSEPWLVIALWALWGLSYTFTSGAFEAWLTDELGVENVGSAFLRGARFRIVGSLTGLLIFGAVGILSLRAAVIGCGALEAAIGLACVVLMPETGFRRKVTSPRERVLVELRTTAMNGIRFVRAQTLVLLLVATELFAGFGAEAFDRLTEAHVIRDVGFPAWLNPIIGFGAVSVVVMVFGFFAVGRVVRRVDGGGMPSVARLLVVFTLATIAGQIAFALGSNFWFVMGVFLAALLTRGLLAPLYTTWLNRQISDSSVRATVLSISSQANATGQATGGPALGVIGNVFGIPAALVAGAFTTLPAAALYLRALRYGGLEPELRRLPAAARAG
jgi:DHA3 family tetracycline resistance protein-like MFS transporter